MGIGFSTFNMIYTAEDILIEKENRIKLQKELMYKFNNPLIFIRVNYPGTNKINNITSTIIQKMDSLISDIFGRKVQVRLFRNSAEGPNVIMILNDSIIDIKKMAVQIEDKHLLGSCINIDVYDNKSREVIDRDALGLDAKRCLICEGLAERCEALKIHNEEEIIKHIQYKYREFMESFYGKII